MSRVRIPEAVLSAAHDRARAREARDWAEADRLRGEIEAAGWRIVDRGTDFALSPAAPPDVEEGERVRYGASANVPSRLDEPPAGIATVVLVATDHPLDLDRTLRALRATAPTGVSIVVVGDGPSDAQATALAGLDDGTTEVAWTIERLGVGAAWAIGARRSVGPVIVMIDTSVEPTGDIVTPLIAALADPTVAVAGGRGLESDDVRTFRDAPAGDVVAIDEGVLAFRRADLVAFGPIEERFTSARHLAIWWSLVLRDGGDDCDAPRRAVAIEGFPAIRHEPPSAEVAPEALPSGPRDRARKRDFYRINDRFGGRLDLLTARP